MEGCTHQGMPAWPGDQMLFPSTPALLQEFRQNSDESRRWKPHQCLGQMPLLSDLIALHTSVTTAE